MALCAATQMAIEIFVQLVQFNDFITHAPVHINDFRGVRARYVKRTG